MRKDIQLTAGDAVSIYETSYMFFTAITQANSFIFSETDLIKAHFTKEKAIKELINQRNGKEGEVEEQQDIDTFDGTTKCAYELQASQLTHENFKVDLALLRNKRSA